MTTITPDALRQLRSTIPDDALIGTLSRQDPDGFGSWSATQQAKNPDMPAKFLINRYYLGSASGRQTPDAPSTKSKSKPQSFSKAAEQSWGQSVLQDAKNVFGGLASAVMNPGQTAMQLGSLATGIGANLEETIRGDESIYNLPGEAGATQLGKNFVDMYGGSPLDAAKNVARKPFTAASDVSAALGLGAAALGTKVGTAGKIGAELQRASRLTDPVLGAAKTVKGAGKLGTEALGLTTGTANAPRAVYEAGKAAPTSYGTPSLDAMRGRTGPTTIVDEARGALDTVKQGRADAYRPRFEAISQNMAPLDLKVIKDTAQGQLAKFGIKLTEDGLDFSRSTISDAAEQAKVRAVMETVNDWGSQQGDNLAIGVDLLKRRLADFDSASGQARAFVTAVHKATRKLLVDQVPGYETMVKDYEKVSNEISEIQKVLSLTDSTSADAAMKKLTSIVRQNNEYRSALVKHLKEISGSDIPGMAAGQMMSTAAPQGLMRAFAGSSLAFGFINPQFWLSLPATSPRLVGELLYAIGYTSGQVGNVMKLLQGKLQLPPGLASPARQTLTLPARSE